MRRSAILSEGRQREHKAHECDYYFLHIRRFFLFHAAKIAIPCEIPKGFPLTSYGISLNNDVITIIILIFAQENQYIIESWRRNNQLLENGRGLICESRVDTK
jgi:hypothetical protein